MSKQTVVQKILEQMNLLSNSDFRFWMLNHADELLAMEKEQMIDMGSHCFARGHKGFQPIESDAEPTAEEYYYEIYKGGEDAV